MTTPSPAALRRAREALRHTDGHDGLCDATDQCGDCKRVAAAIDEAVAAERERCLAACIPWEKDWPVPVTQIIVEIEEGARAHEEGGDAD